METRSGYRCRQNAASKYKQEGDGFIEHIKGKLSTPLGQRDDIVRDYQIQAVLDTRTYFQRNGRRAQPALIVAPTGAGKTGMVAMLPYVLESKKVLVLSPSLDITSQLASAFGIGPGGLKNSFFWKTRLFTEEEELRKFLEPGHVIRECKDFLNNTDLDRLVIVSAQKFGGQSGASLVHRNQTIVENVREAFKSFDTLIVDEAHHYPAATWKNIVEQFRDQSIIFLTATPYRRGRNGEQVNILGALQQITFEIKRHILEGTTIRKLDFDEFSLDTSGLGHRRNLLGCPGLIEAIGKRIRTILAIHDAQMPAFRHKAMCFVRTKTEALICSQHLGEATHVTSDKATDKNKTDFDNPNGPFRILVSCGRLLEGYDNPDISVCVILRKVGSSNMFKQFVGRCLRVSEQGDPVIAAIRSLPCYEQKPMWDIFDKVVPEVDPEDEEEEGVTDEMMDVGP